MFYVSYSLDVKFLALFLIFPLDLLGKMGRPRLHHMIRSNKATDVPLKKAKDAYLTKKAQY